MESFEVVLSASGHRNSLGRSNEVFKIISSNPDRMNELFDCIYADDAWVRMRAIDTFEKLVRDDPKLARPYTKILVDDLTKKSQPSIQWHLAQLFAEIELSRPQSEKVVAWLKNTLANTNIDWIVAANVMKTLVFFYKKGMFDTEGLLALLKVQTKHTSKTVRKKATDYLGGIQ